jgi:hypothetical protein
MPDPFISEDDLSDILGRDVTDDLGATIAVDAACDICRDVAEQTFNRGTSTFTLNGSGTDALMLPEMPVNSISSVVVNGGTVTNYRLAENGILYRGTISAGASTEYDTNVIPSVWPSGRQNVSVTYDHGYADADIPRSVRMVALSLAQRIVTQGPAVEESQGDLRVKYAGPAMDLTKGEERILRKHKRHR